MIVSIIGFIVGFSLMLNGLLNDHNEYLENAFINLQKSDYVLIDPELKEKYDEWYKKESDWIKSFPSSIDNRIRIYKEKEKQNVLIKEDVFPCKSIETYKKNHKDFFKVAITENYDSDFNKYCKKKK